MDVALAQRSRAAGHMHSDFIKARVIDVTDDGTPIEGEFKSGRRYGFTL